MTSDPKKDGGLAFPGSRFEPASLNSQRPRLEVQYPGMSLRDWFAGQAIGALIGNGHDKASAVEYAYSTADAMLAERSK